VYSRQQKEVKSNKISNFENVQYLSRLDLHILSFLKSLKYNEFGLEFFHTSRSYYYLYYSNKFSKMLYGAQEPYVLGFDANNKKLRACSKTRWLPKNPDF
jgi:hypothetical protein